MSDVKYTKKASARIIKEVQKFNFKASANTSYDQAFVALMTEWDMELGVETTNTSTTCAISRDGSVVHTMEFDNVWDNKVGDWNWNVIYKDVLEHIIKTRMYKRPKISKRELNRIAKEVKEKAEAEKKAAKAAKVATKKESKTTTASKRKNKAV